MDIFLKIVIVYLILNTLIWLLRHLNISRAKRNSESLDSRYPIGKFSPMPKVSVLVAGKNEERNIERCLRSLLGQNYPELQVIAINDRSTDRTGEIMDKLAGQSGGRLKVVHVRQLPDGWKGKPHAMHEGQKLATGDYLVFTDADCFFQCPDCIRIAVEFTMEKKVDLLSVLPVLETSSFWERVLQPVCSAVLIIWFQPERVNNPMSKVAYANGAFMLFSRSCYDRIGGHPAVKEHLMEDMAFARRVKGSGMKLYVVQNRDLYRARMYEDFSSTFTGWSRIFYGGFMHVSKVARAVLLLVIMSLLPCLILAGALMVATIKAWDVRELGWWVLAWSGFAMAAQMSVSVRFYQLMGSKWYWAITYPLGAMVTFMILMSSLKKFMGGTIVWRGSEIKL
ncbi:MAG: glycosyltransferase [Phycisphaerae bacterium]